MKDIIRKILREEFSPAIKRRLKFDNIDKAIKKNKISSFMSDKPIEESIEVALQKAMFDIMPKGFEDDDKVYFKVWDEIKDYLRGKYTDELTQYFEKRKKDFEEENEKSDDVEYIFVKHDKPYYSDWRGFSEGFKSFNNLISRYGHWVDVDWDEVKQKLDNINDYPERTFRGTMNSRPLRISSAGDEGNDWGYNFSIIKEIPRDYSQEMKEGELTEKCWKGYTQKGMKTMFGKRYPNCVKKTK